MKLRSLHSSALWLTKSLTILRPTHTEEGSLYIPERERSGGATERANPMRTILKERLALRTARGARVF